MGNMYNIERDEKIGLNDTLLILKVPTMFISVLLIITDGVAIVNIELIVSIKLKLTLRIQKCVFMLYASFLVIGVFPISMQIISNIF